MRSSAFRARLIPYLLLMSLAAINCSERKADQATTPSVVSNQGQLIFSPRHPKVREAEKLLKQQNTYAAVELLTQLIKSQPLPEAFYFRGVAYLTRNEYDPAILDLQEALKRDPELRIAHEHLGSAYFLINRFEEALKHLDLAIQFSPASGDAHFYRAGANYKLKKHKEAERDFLKSLELKPGQENFHFAVGHFYSTQEEWAKAIPHYTKVIEINPKNGRAYKFRGRAQEALGLKSEAAVDFQRAADRGVASK